MILLKTNVVFSINIISILLRFIGIIIFWDIMMGGRDVLIGKFIDKKYALITRNLLVKLIYFLNIFYY